MLLLTPKTGKISGHKITFDHHGKGYTWIVSPRSELADAIRDGAKVLVYFDPTDARIAHVARLDGRYLGEVKRFGPVDITKADEINEAEKVLATLYAEVLATVRERPLHVAENARLEAGAASNAALVAEAEAQRNTQGVTATLGREIVTTTDGNPVTATGADLAARVASGTHHAKVRKASAQAVQKRDARLAAAAEEALEAAHYKAATPALPTSSDE